MTAHDNRAAWREQVHAELNAYFARRSPPLPPWCKPLRVDSEQVSVLRVASDSACWQYVFFVNAVGRLSPVAKYALTPGKSRSWGPFTAAPPDVWREAAGLAERMMQGRRRRA